MNLYLLSQDENNGYDTYDSVVVAAENEQEAAAEILPSEWIQWGESYSPWASSSANVTVEYLGKAKEGRCVSFV